LILKTKLLCNKSNYFFLNNTDISEAKYRLSLIRLGNHSVLAIIALISIGSATRVMEAGLACPDWPLCYGNFFPASHMNLQVFLEWFHRLDAFFVGTVILAQFILSLIWRRYLPCWVPKTYSIILFLIVLQGSLGALTVINTLASVTVTAHLLVALLILITSIFVNQNLEIKEIQSEQSGERILYSQIFWWKTSICFPLILTFLQSIIGARLASTWSAHLCLDFYQQCINLNIHKLFAIPTGLSILIPIFISFSSKHLFVNNNKLLISIFILLVLQISLGFFSLVTNLSQPFILVSHQLIASLLIANLSALFFKQQNNFNYIETKNTKLIIN